MWIPLQTTNNCVNIPSPLYYAMCEFNDRCFDQPNYPFKEPKRIGLMTVDEVKLLAEATVKWIDAQRTLINDDVDKISEDQTWCGPKTKVELEV